MLTTDARYQILATYSAQHLRAVAHRILARAELPALHLSSLSWRAKYLSPIPPVLQPGAADAFFKQTGCRYPYPSGLRSWLTPGKKPLLDIHAADKLIALAAFIEKDWNLCEQAPVWRKQPSNRLNGYAYNLIQMLIDDNITDDYPPEYNVTFQYDLLDSTLKSKRVNHWLQRYQENAQDPFVVASLSLTMISNMRVVFLWRITLETRNGLYTSFEAEAVPGSSPLYHYFFRRKRIHPFIGYI